MIGRTGRGIPCVVFGVLAGACAAEAALALPSETQVVAAFEARVKEYVDLHRKLEAKLPKLPKQSTPVQVDKHQLALGNRIKSARRDAAPGEFFTREMQALLRRVLGGGLAGPDGEAVKARGRGQ